METATFANCFYRKPQDRQVVWLLIDGEDTPMPAQYSAQRGDGKPNWLSGEYYSLLGGREHWPRQGDGWAVLEPPENANLCSPK